MRQALVPLLVFGLASSWALGGAAADEAPEEAPVPLSAPAAASSDVGAVIEPEAPPPVPEEKATKPEAGPEGDSEDDAGEFLEAGIEDPETETGETIEVEAPTDPGPDPGPRPADAPADDPVAEAACREALGALEPARTLRCPVALALSRWVAHVVEPMAKFYLNRPIAGVAISTGYQCRKRRGGDGQARWSEHAFANGIDVMAVTFAEGNPVAIQPRQGEAAPERAFQAAIRGGACAFFRTVLGPGTNAAHANHLHLDMAERPGGYRLCE